MKTALAIIAVVISLPFSQRSIACSCALQSVEQLYSQAEILMLVEVGRRESLPDPGSSRIESGRSWSFRLVELFKGDPAFDRLWSRGNSASCGANLIENRQYLVSPQADGQVSLCSAWHLDGNGFVEARVAALREALSGEEVQFSEPLIFNQYDEGCSLFHRTPEGGELRFEFRSRAPDDVPQTQWLFDYPDSDEGYRVFSRAHEIRGVHPGFTPGHLGLYVSYPHGALVRKGSGRVFIGPSSWPTRRAPMRRAYSHPRETADEDHVKEILDALQSERGVSLRWTWHGLGEWDWGRSLGYPDARSDTQALFTGDALDRFLACIDGGVDEN